ncbi:MAG: class I SAM-dependent methyltransferase [Oscillospiraceae bacterium]|jgi:SAM-dependent methyltransferase|nr:class I SAM-dependent methyltransferase [Oscillospiraceae bacterium]
MVSQENSTGKPLADFNWLALHHRAKLPERTTFAKRIATLEPKSVVDLGCASGLWLEVLDQFLPTECEFIGIDSDEKVLNMAVQRSSSWQRKTSFIQLDLEREASQIPPCDLTLAFNIFPYIKNLDLFIDILSCRVPHGTLAIRQYDGASLRFGPMPTSKRQEIEVELRIATENSKQFYHYDLDRTFKILRQSSYQISNYEFELFERSSPFTAEFLPYYKDTLLWTCQFLSKKSADYLHTWIDADPLMLNHYFYEVDLVAILS